ncbi:MAG: hypothetical protein VX641_01715 [Planctomycetota bacterium]|nr:hypothetical protein [Planctomycetota bacterium]
MRFHALVLAASAGLTLTPGATAAAAPDDGDCEVAVTPLTPPPGDTGAPENAPWVGRFSDSIGAAVRTAGDQAIPFDDRLRTLPLRGAKQAGITINALITDPGQESYREEVYLPNPVLVATWIGSHRNLNPGLGELVPFQDFAMFQEYRSNPDDGNLNLWFATACNASTFIQDVLQEDPSCMNPELGVDACNQAITLGLPSVGVPYAFGPMADANDQWDPYAPGALWWQADLMIAVADRSALIRPSLNPTVAPNSTERPTADGRPIWDGTRYRRPEPADAIYPAVMEKLDGSPGDVHGPKEFVGYLNRCPPIDPSDPQPEPMTFRGADGFWQWLEYWQYNSWYGPHAPDQTMPPQDQPGCPLADEYAPYNRFPFSGLGLSLYWNLELAGVDPPPAEFYSVSEFIQVGEQPIYVVGVYQGAQVLGGGLPGSGQVPWYQSCNSDFNMDGTVDGQDLAILLAQWNTVPATPQDPPNMCVNRDKLEPAVGAGALIEFLQDWGPCAGWPKSLSALDPACR